MTAANDNIPGAIEHRRTLVVFNFILAGLVILFLVACAYAVVNGAVLAVISQTVPK